MGSRCAIIHSLYRIFHICSMAPLAFFQAEFAIVIDDKGVIRKKKQKKEELEVSDEKP